VTRHVRLAAAKAINIASEPLRLTLCDRRLIIRDDASTASNYVANYIVGTKYLFPLANAFAWEHVLSECAERIKAFNPSPSKPFVLGLPTGSSPELIYKSLVQKYKNGEISFKNVITFNMVRPPCPPDTPHSALATYLSLLANQKHEQLLT
jgi:hypothetical protein